MTTPELPARRNGSVSFEEAQQIARKHAKAEPESYYSEPFEPHLWVINAIIEASATWYDRAVEERIKRVAADRAASEASRAAGPDELAAFEAWWIADPTESEKIIWSQGLSPNKYHALMAWQARAALAAQPSVAQEPVALNPLTQVQVAAICAIRDAAPVAPAAGPWIAMSERLPELDVLVLGAEPSGAISVFMRDNGGGEGWLWARLTFAWNITDPNGIECDDDYEVTHWMPLPESPKTIPTT